jgi:hypothetical protein
VPSAANHNEKLLSYEDQVLGEQPPVSLDAASTANGSTSGSDPDFTSDWEFSTDDEDEETTDEYDTPISLREREILTEVV